MTTQRPGEIKVLMVDPWGINNLSYYTNGLCSGIHNQVSLTLAVNYHFQKTTNDNYDVLRIFFRFSEKMGRTWLRKGLRGFEYLINLVRVLIIIKKGNYDVVHFQWLHIYKLDNIFLKIIKKHCNGIVYTAHNVIPHIDGEKYINDLRCIYGRVDKIIVHGDEVKKQFLELFPEFQPKLLIQKHGAYANQSTSFDMQLIDPEIVMSLNSHEKIFIFFGNIFYNKGIDMLLKIWLSFFKNSRHLLIIAGKTTDSYPEFDFLTKKIDPAGNVLLFNWYVDENLMNFLVNKSDIMVLPYRKASMSGVIFTAAEFNKPVITTTTGSITEYIINNENSFAIDSNEDAIKDILEKVMKDISKTQLSEMGRKLNRFIHEHYSWDKIGEKLVKDCYYSFLLDKKKS